MQVSVSLMSLNADLPLQANAVTLSQVRVQCMIEDKLFIYMLASNVTLCARYLSDREANRLPGVVRATSLEHQSTLMVCNTALEVRPKVYHTIVAVVPGMH